MFDFQIIEKILYISSRKHNYDVTKLRIIYDWKYFFEKHFQ
ncbi:hypothetical protein BN938_2097 [Mucinivorans hirudinis]|uniref:Uncharacterized protein n=1 Tax=Mucinivorans hirudinis TaxID=1433126 RepID=A0A060R997_9BACT|nr:hypothetical protein BN938_2097 [Mucinivorans hirudinis]